MLFAELSPQEVIQTISKKDAPHSNCFFSNPMECCGVVKIYEQTYHWRPPKQIRRLQTRGNEELKYLQKKFVSHMSKEK